MDKKSYRWVICAGCTLMFFCTAGLGMTGFSVYQPYLISLGGLSNAQASMLTSIRSMFTFITLFVAARILNLTDIRLGALISVLGITLSMLLYGAADNFAIYALAAAAAGSSYGIGGMLAVSVMIHRWFEDHQALAVGICSASSGFSAVCGTPVIAWMVESFSLRQAFFMEAAFVAVLGVLVYALLRNRPKGEERPPQFVTGRKKKGSAEKMYRLPDGMERLVLAGILFMGFTYAASSHISVLFNNSGYESAQVALLVSVMGAALLIGKCAYGEVADRIGSYRSGNVFFAMLIAGSALCCLAPMRSMVLAVSAVILVSAGSVLLSVGLTVIADKIADKQYYAVVVRQIQIVYMLGSMLFGVVPGMIADACGSYIPAYIIVTVFAAAAALAIQPVLKKADDSRE